MLRKKGPAPGKGGKKRKSDADESPAPTKRGKADKTNGKMTLPDGSWEDVVSAITTIEQVDEADADGVIKSGLRAFILLSNGEKRCHSMPMIRQKCPQKVTRSSWLLRLGSLTDMFCSFWITTSSICT